MTTSAYIVGVDIGYSNVKLVCGSPSQPATSCVRPAGVAPANHTGLSLSLYDYTQSNSPDYYMVSVDDTVYAACIEHSSMGRYTRVVHEGYPLTPEYLALFRAALLMTDQNAISLVVTGLPVSQFLDEELRMRVRDRLVGEHRVTPKVVVTVEDVRVVAQPIGGCVAYQFLHQKPWDRLKILVVDQGYFSLDWVMVQDMQVQRYASGSSTEAMSVVLEDAVRMLGQDYGVVIPSINIERSLRLGEPTVVVRGTPIDYQPYLQRAVSVHANTIVGQIRNSLRGFSDELDLIILTGGGAAMFKPIFETAYPGIPIGEFDNPVLANAYGYWCIGGSLCQRS